MSPVTPNMFARYLDELLADESQDPVLIDSNECTALLSLLQYLVEDWGELPEDLIPAVIHLNNRFGARMVDAYPELREPLAPPRRSPEPPVNKKG